MRNALPVMTEHADTLKQRFQRAHDGRKKPRLQLLDLLASGQAQARQAVAQLLGVHRHTIGHWLAIDEARGLDALLALHVPAGKPLSPPDVLAAIAQALQQPTGVASDDMLRPWGQQTYPRDLDYHPPSTIVRTKCEAKLQVARPSHTKSP
jgi:hypothetical protein